MSVKRPGSALSSGAEPLEPLNPKELQKTVKSGGFAEQLDAVSNAAAAETGGADGTSETQSATLKGLQSIAANADFSTEEKTEAVIRESARFMIKSRIEEKFREQDKVTEMLEDLSNFVSKDPFLRKKLKDILQRLKEK